MMVHQVINLVLVSTVFFTINAQICTKQEIQTTYVPKTREVQSRFNSNKMITETYHEEVKRITNKQVCCKGYIKKNKKCLPFCKEVCENGLCTAPGECTCKQGYKKMSTHRCVPSCEDSIHCHCVAPNVCNCYNGYIKINGTCVADCGEKCVNADCIEPNICKCFEGYTKTSHDSNQCFKEIIPELEIDEITNDLLINTTPEYIKDFDELSPENLTEYNEYTTESDENCDLPCVNGICIGNNTCLCDENYKLVEDDPFICEPICEFQNNQTCINAECTGPNACLCFDGYQKVSEFECTPICSSCVNSSCIGPDLCECWKGFVEKTKNLCTPECNPKCQNSFCVAPNVCECFEEYNKVSDYECVPKNYFTERANCLKFCKNGECNTENQCVCPENFKLKDGICRELCDLNCENGECLDNECICDPGYETDPENKKICSPVCAFEDDHYCINGRCIAPNVCECFEGYEKLENLECTCVALCNPPCKNAKCIEPNVCECFEGLKPFNDSHCFSEEYYDQRSKCLSSCTNGYCSEENNCICYIDYELNEDGICEEECNLTCENGICKHHKCVCNDHFKLSYEDSTKCEPICEFEFNQTCVNGICENPNVCKCLNGFEMSADNNFTCVLTQDSKNKINCVANCLNGYCTNSHKCLCNEGFVKDEDGICIEKCGIQCQNSTCKNQKCICFDGFSLSEMDPTICEPICNFEANQTCVNGICIEPNVCQCFEGYHLMNDNFTCFDIIQFQYEVPVDLDTTDEFFDSFELSELSDMSSISQILAIMVMLALFLLVITIITMIWLQKYSKIDYIIHDKEQSSNCVYFTQSKGETELHDDFF